MVFRYGPIGRFVLQPQACQAAVRIGTKAGYCRAKSATGTASRKRQYGIKRGLMATLIIILFIVASIHFLYESTILPSIRVGLRFDLFELRDRLRNLLDTKKIDSDKYRHLQSSINATIDSLHSLDMLGFVNCQRVLKANPRWNDLVTKRQQEIDSYDQPEFREIRKRHIQLAMKTFAANSGMLIFYLGLFIVPAILVWKFWVDIFNYFRWLTSIPSGLETSLFPRTPVYAQT
jgi:hypothetical protein